MKTILVIYDQTGYIIFYGSGNVREPVGVPFLWVDVPEGKRVKSIDVTSEAPTPVFEDISKTEVQLLQEQVDALNIAMAEMLGV